MRLIAETLSVRRGDDLLFSNVSFTLGEGEALVVTGRNGSGKSTLLRTVAGLIRPDSGKVRAGQTRIRRDRAGSSPYLGHRNAMKTGADGRGQSHRLDALLGDVAEGRGSASARR